jgi:hypothetical protein
VALNPQPVLVWRNHAEPYETHVQVWRDAAEGHDHWTVVFSGAFTTGRFEGTRAQVATMLRDVLGAVDPPPAPAESGFRCTLCGAPLDTHGICTGASCEDRTHDLRARVGRDFVDALRRMGASPTIMAAAARAARATLTLRDRRAPDLGGAG